MNQKILQDAFTAMAARGVLVTMTCNDAGERREYKGEFGRLTYERSGMTSIQTLEGDGVEVNVHSYRGAPYQVNFVRGNEKAVAALCGKITL